MKAWMRILALSLALLLSIGVLVACGDNETDDGKTDGGSTDGGVTDGGSTDGGASGGVGDNDNKVNVGDLLS